MPLRAHVWNSKRQWSRSQLDRERQEFFDTRVTGRQEIWATLKVVVGLLAQGEIQDAQGILDASAITVPTGDLMNGVYDEVGNFYQLPEHIISDPENLVLGSQENVSKGESGSDVTDEDEVERRREEKGKGVLKTGEVIKVKARLSDRGGPDIIITIGREQNVRVLVRRIQEEINVTHLLKRIAVKDLSLTRPSPSLQARAKLKLLISARSSRMGRHSNHKDGGRDTL